MDAKELEVWIEHYGRAWEKRDARAAAALFAVTATYHETPFDKPFRGREAIGRYWQDATGSQRDVSFSASVLLLTGDTGVARWKAAFQRVPSGTRVELDGIFLLEFTEDGLCSTLREWWHASTSPAPGP